jgi:hypothetical protein
MHKKMKLSEEISEIRKELKIPSGIEGGAVRNKILKLQNLLGRINELLDEYNRLYVILEAEIEAKSQYALAQIHVKEAEKSTLGQKKTPASIKVAIANTQVKVVICEQETTVADAMVELSHIAADLRALKDLHDQCDSAIQALRSALSYDKIDFKASNGA